MIDFVWSMSDTYCITPYSAVNGLFSFNMWNKVCILHIRDWKEPFLFIYLRVMYRYSIHVVILGSADELSAITRKYTPVQSYAFGAVAVKFLNCTCAIHSLIFMSNYEIAALFSCMASQCWKNNIWRHYGVLIGLPVSTGNSLGDVNNHHDKNMI